MKNRMAVMNNGRPVLGFYSQNVFVATGCTRCRSTSDALGLQLGVLCADDVMDRVCEDCAQRLNPALVRAWESLLESPLAELGDCQSGLWQNEAALDKRLRARGLALLPGRLIVLTADEKAARAVGGEAA